MRNGFPWSQLQGSCFELACESSQRVLWPRKVQLYSPRHYLTEGLYNFWYLRFSRCDCTGSYKPWESFRFLPLIFAVFGLLVTIKPCNEVNVRLKLGNTLKHSDFGQYGTSERSHRSERLKFNRTLLILTDDNFWLGGNDVIAILATKKHRWVPKMADS